RPLQIRRKPIRKRWRRSDRFGNHVGKLCGMRGGENQTLRWLAVYLFGSFPAKNAHRGMRIAYVAVLFPNGFHFRERIFVTRAVSPDFALHVLQTAPAQIEQTRKI